MDKQALIVKAKEYTAARYSNGYGWQVFTECYGTAEWNEFIDGNEYEATVTNWSEAKAKLHELAGIVSGHHDEIVSEADNVSYGEW